MPRPPTQLRLSAAIVDLDRRVVCKGDTEQRLTATEDKLLRFLIARAGTVVPREELLQEVWGYKPGLETRAVDSAVRRLRVKIEHDPKNPVHLKKVYGQGYLFDGGDFRASAAPRPIHAGDPSLSNLINPTTARVGMDSAIEALCAAFTAGGALTTIVGPPGSGKTRLAQSVALQLAEGADLEVWWCEATAARSATDLQRLVAGILGADLKSAGGETGPDVIICGALSARPRVLIVLDNCEQLEVDARRSIAAWTRGAPQAGLLLTSREPMDLPAEEVFPVASLSTAEALKLFILRAQTARPGFGIDQATQEQIEALILDVDHLPLAIELCAALMDMLGPAALHKRLKRTGRLPTAGSVGRHATLSAALASSWEALSDGERDTLAGCAVFAERFDLAAAEALLQQGGDEVLHLRTLVQRSLVTTVPTDDSIQYRMLASIRRFGTDQLGASAGEIRLRHAQWLAESLDPPGTRWSIEVDPVLRMRARRVHPDVEQAIRWSTDRFPSLAARLALVADRVLSLTEAPNARIARLVIAVADASAAGDAALQVEVHVRLATAYGQGGDYTAAADVADNGHEIAQQSGDPQLIGHTQYALGRVAIWRDQYEEACTRLKQARDALADSGDLLNQAHAAMALGYAHSYKGQLEEAQTHNLEALSLFRRIGDQTGVASALGSLATLDLTWGRITEAEGRYREALEIMEGAGYRGQVATLHGHLGNCHFEAMRLDEALAEYEQAIEGHQAVGRVRLVSVVETNAASLDICRGDIDKARLRLGKVLGRLREHPSARTEGYAQNNLAVIAYLNDRDDEAIAAIERSMVCFREADDEIGEATTQATRASILAATGEIQGASEALASAEKMYARCPTPALETGLSAARQMIALQEDPGGPALRSTQEALSRLCQDGMNGLYHAKVLQHALARLT